MLPRPSEMHHENAQLSRSDDSGVMLKLRVNPYGTKHLQQHPSALRLLTSESEDSEVRRADAPAQLTQYESCSATSIFGEPPKRGCTWNFGHFGTALGSTRTRAVGRIVLMKSHKPSPPDPLPASQICARHPIDRSQSLSLEVLMMRFPSYDPRASTRRESGRSWLVRRAATGERHSRRR